MKIPDAILKRRKEYMTRGDNVIVAKMASTSRRKITSRDVETAVRRGRTRHERIVVALYDYYARKSSILLKLSNLEINQ